MAKKALSRIGQILLAVLFMPIGLVMCFCLLFYTPIDYIRYRRTHFYQNTNTRYTWLAAISYCVRLYEVIQKANLPIEFTANPNSACHGWFRYQDYLLFNAYTLSYCEEQGTWVTEIEDEYIPIEDVLMEEIREYNALVQAPPASKALLLVEDSDLSEDDLSSLKNCQVLLTDQKDVAKVLQVFIASQNAQ